jgi:hypothetical protein
LGRAADRTDDNPAPKKPPRRTRFTETNAGWWWRCTCGAQSWRPDLDTETVARADHANHLREAPVHRQTGWFNPKDTR